MILGICPKCTSYEVLQVKNLSCGSTICLCDNCSSNLNEEDLQPKKMSGFATMLANTAQNLADKGDQYALNAVKLEARKAKECGFLKDYELLQVERHFVTLQPT